MALVNCPECGKEVSDKASMCPNCGCPVCAVSKTIEPFDTIVCYGRKKITGTNNQIIIQGPLLKDNIINVEDIRKIYFRESSLLGSGFLCIGTSYEPNVYGNEKNKVVFNGSQNKQFVELALCLSKALNIPIEKKNSAVMDEIREDADKVKQLKKEGIAYCPKCHSTSITFTEKRLSIGRAAVGGVLAGGAGAVLGGLSSKKGKNKCMKCGYEWKV